jgi:DNA-binding transcriptional ArsR family regulator
MDLSQNNQTSLTESKELKASLSYGDLKVDFSGSPESVLRSINDFVSKHIPAFNLASGLLLNYGAAELVEFFKDYVRITPEGPWIISPTELSDKELVAAQLVAQRIAAETGNSGSLSVPLSKLLESTGLNPKTLSSRLSELLKAGLVVRESSESGSLYRISTQGISWLREALEKKRERSY